MNYKIEGAIKRNRKNFIIFAILWVFIAIVFVSPFAYSSYMAGLEGKMNLEIFFDVFSKSIANPFGTIANIFSQGVTGTYFSTLLIVTIFYSVFFFILEIFFFFTVFQYAPPNFLILQFKISYIYFSHLFNILNNISLLILSKYFLTSIFNT